MPAPAATFEHLIAEAVRTVVREELAPLRARLELLGGGPELVTLPDAASRLGVTLRAVQRWAKNGRLEVVQVGGARMVRFPGGAGP